MTALRYTLATIAALAGTAPAVAQGTLPSNGADYERDVVVDTFLNCGQGNFTQASMRTEICLETMTNVSRNLSQYYARQVTASGALVNLGRMARRCDLGLASEIREGNLAERPNQVLENNVGCLNELNGVRTRSGVQPNLQVTYSIAVSLVECARGDQSYCGDLDRFYSRPAVQPLIREL